VVRHTREREEGSRYARRNPAPDLDSKTQKAASRTANRRITAPHPWPSQAINEMGRLVGVSQYVKTSHKLTSSDLGAYSFRGCVATT